MKINLEINAPTPEEFGELIFTLLHTAYGVDPDTVKQTWDQLVEVAKIIADAGPVETAPDHEEAVTTYHHYVEVGTVIRDMQLAYYQAGATAGMQAAQIAGPIESQN